MSSGSNKKKSRTFSAEYREKALALVEANGGRLRETARQLGDVSLATLKRWWKGPSDPSDATEKLKRDMLKELEEIIWKLLAAIPEKIERAPLLQAITSLKITRETLQAIKAKQLDRFTRPLNLTKMTDEQLHQLERTAAYLIRDLSGGDIPECPGAAVETGQDDSTTRPAGLEPVIPPAPLLAGSCPFGAEIPELHRWIDGQLRDLHGRRGSRLAIIAPRESAKTTWITLAYVLRCAVEGLERYILLLSDSEAQAEQFLAAIRCELERVEAPEIPRESTAEGLDEAFTLANIYPEACGPGPEWRKDHLHLKNGVLIESLGRGSKVRGRKHGAYRPTLIVIDDCQSNRDILSAKERRNALDWFKQEVIPCGSKETNIISVGSALHREAVAVEALGMPGWTSVTFPAILGLPERLDLWKQWELLATNLADDRRNETADNFYSLHKLEMDRGGISYWPSQQPLPHLMMRRAEIGERQFETEYQGNPGSPEGAEWPGEYFDRPDFRFDDWPEDIVRTVIALDPSKGRDAGHGDFQAIAIVSLVRDGTLWVDCECRREPVPRMVARTLALAAEHRPFCVAVETNQGLDLLIPEFERQMAAQGNRVVPLQSVEHYRDSKFARIRRLGIYLAHGQIRVKNTPGGRLLVEQLREFPRGAHDDAPDALEIAIRRLELLSTGK